MRALAGRRALQAALLLSSVPGLSGSEKLEERAERVLVGGESSYTVKAGDSLALVGSRLGVAPGVLARMNGLRNSDRLSVGQTLRVDNRHVVPFSMEDGVLINVPQRLLFLFEDRGLVAWYPVGLGRRNWETTLGHFEVRTRERSPTWHVPASIQEEMRLRGRPVRTRIAPGPDNPLGDYWIGLEGSRCGIHGTNAPASVYRFSTHGCVRLHPEDIVELFSRITIGTPVWVVDEPILLAQVPDGAVFLEVNPEIYPSPVSPAARVADLARRQGLASALDAEEVARVIALREGLARRVDGGRPADGP